MAPGAARRRKEGSTRCEDRRSPAERRVGRPTTVIACQKRGANNSNSNNNNVGWGNIRPNVPGLLQRMSDFDIIGFLVQCWFSTLDFVRKFFMNIRVFLRSHDECVRSSVSGPACRRRRGPKGRVCLAACMAGLESCGSAGDNSQGIFFAALPSSQPYARQAARIYKVVHSFFSGCPSQHPRQKRRSKKRRARVENITSITVSLTAQNEAGRQGRRCGGQFHPANAAI